MSEGTYPFALGGVSVWCDQLVRGLPEYRWEAVALTVDGRERPRWDMPANVDRVVSIPLWSAGGSGRRRPRGRPAAVFRAAYDALLTALTTPPEESPHRAAVQRSRFLLALRGLYEFAAGGGDLGAAIRSNAALGAMQDRWREVGAALGFDHPALAGRPHRLTLADAAQAATLIGHMLRPLAVPPVRADVVHCAMNGLSTLVGMTAKWAHDTPLLISEHGVYLRERYLEQVKGDLPHAVAVLLLGFQRGVAGAAYHLADALAPHSAYNRRWQLRNGADPGRMWTMYNGVAPELFPSAKTEPDEPTIVYVGRIDPLKDLHTLIRAFALVRERVPGARLRICGAASDLRYRDSCLALIEQLGLTGAARMEGSVPDVVEAYHSGNVVALTSISEGFPYSVVEAMACGRTMVCTNVGGVSEAVGDAGFVVAPRDADAIADACVTLLRDPELRRELAAKARQRVLDRFTLAQSLDDYRGLYEQLVTPALQRAPAGGAAGVPRAVVGRAAAGRALIPHPVSPAEANRRDAGGLAGPGLARGTSAGARR
ncbi:GT4 family glycosyltransferase PelF [Dactylosporangium sp. NPDC051484]|uniref:GT4 family glycosyltransferase PelF n=1 Tax=Dactylosporangium sp. NPDC051484 TaxID=3154942 RepID=UPI003450DC1E